MAVSSLGAFIDVYPVKVAPDVIVVSSFVEAFVVLYFVAWRRRASWPCHFFEAFDDWYTMKVASEDIVAVSKDMMF